MAKRPQELKDQPQDIRVLDVLTSVWKRHFLKLLFADAEAINCRMDAAERRKEVPPPSALKSDMPSETGKWEGWSVEDNLITPECAIPLILSAYRHCFLTGIWVSWTPEELLQSEHERFGIPVTSPQLKDYRQYCKKLQWYGFFEIDKEGKYYFSDLAKRLMEDFVRRSEDDDFLLGW